MVAKKYFTENNKRAHANATFRAVNREFPQLIRLLLDDLQQIEGYSDVEIGFGAGVGLDVIRKINLGDMSALSPQVFFNILGLYAKVFCNWHKLRYDIVARELG